MHKHHVWTRAFLRSVFVGLALLAFAGCAQQAPKPEKPGFVIQVSDNDPAKWNLALNNAKNVQKDLGADKAEVEIVAYGPGLNMLKAESEVANRIQDALKDGVKVVACGNTMKGMKLEKADLVPGVAVVKAGVLEIGEKQRAGWTYIRP
ncbi:DsrE family protein [Thiobacter aerophilum]|uniref:DsrE family protein n=1 Tax=Thiobacter aerophilum TaxID=3121275 RepID=A0ABV0ECV3_9BURK